MSVHSRRRKLIGASSAQTAALDPPPAAPRRPRLGWASLHRRTWEVDIWACPCGGRRKVLAVVTSPGTGGADAAEHGHRRPAWHLATRGAVATPAPTRAGPLTMRQTSPRGGSLHWLRTFAPASAWPRAPPDCLAAYLHPPSPGLVRSAHPASFPVRSSSKSSGSNSAVVFFRPFAISMGTGPVNQPGLQGSHGKPQTHRPYPCLRVPRFWQSSCSEISSSRPALSSGEEKYSGQEHTGARFSEFEAGSRGPVALFRRWRGRCSFRCADHCGERTPRSRREDPG